MRHYYGPDGWCRVDGGTVPPSHCPKCRRDVDWTFVWLMKRADRLAGGR